MSELVPSPDTRPIRGGQPTKCTPEVIQIVADAIREGMSTSGAMRLARVDVNVLYGRDGWVHRGERGEEPWATFVREVAFAAGEAEQKAVRALVNGWDRDWRAAISWLNRRFPAEWQERSQLDLNVGAGEDPIEVFKAELERVMDRVRGEHPEGP